MTEPREKDDDPKFWQVYACADAVLDGTITADEARRFDELLRTDSEARQHYIQFMHDSAVFCQWSQAALRAGDAEGLGTRATADDLPADAPSADCSPRVVSRPPSVIFHDDSRLPGGVASLTGSRCCCSAPQCLQRGRAGCPTVFHRPPRRRWRRPPSRRGPPRLSERSIVGGRIPARRLVSGAPVCAGRRIVLESGLLEILYDDRGEVILQGPVDYTVDSANGGFLASGRVTVRLVKTGDPAADKRLALRPAFAIRTAASLTTNLGAESGVEVMRSTEFAVVAKGSLASRTCVFRGKVAVELLDGERSLPAIPVDAGRSAVAERSSPARQGMIFVGDGTGAPGLFAHRVVVPIGGDRGGAYQTAWLKAIGTGPQKRFVAVGTGEDVDLPPGDAGGGGSASSGPSSDGPSQTPGGADPPVGIVSTCRLTFDLGDLDPTTAWLQFRYVARNRVIAIRLNGKEFPRTCRANAGAPPGYACGQFFIRGRGGLEHETFVRGVNSLEVDVDSRTWHTSAPSHMLRIRAEVSGIRAPRRGGPAPTRRGAGNVGGAAGGGGN